MTDFIPFPKIGAFHQVVKHARAKDNRGRYREVEYRGSVKLHGTNAGVRVTPDGRVIPQSRSRVLTPGDDNYGFAAFVAEREDVIRDLACGFVGQVVFFGEWCGPGIQKDVAVSQLPERQWVLFSAAVRTEDGSLRFMGVRGADRSSDEYRIYGIIKACVYRMTVDLEDPASCSAAVDTINAATQAVEDECPWARRFGISGVGEGLVWTPVGEHAGNTDLWFKSKGSKHRGGPKTHKPASVSAEQHASIDAYVATHVHAGRVQQGVDFVREQGQPIDMTATGTFLAWVVADVQSEHADAAVGLDTKALRKAIGREALRQWKEIAS